jgi:hypothetical protein
LGLRLEIVRRQGDSLHFGLQCLSAALRIVLQAMAAGLRSANPFAARPVKWLPERTGVTYTFYKMYE